LARDDLLNGALELVVDDRAGVELACPEHLGDAAADALGGGEAEARPAHVLDGVDDVRAVIAPELIAPLAPDAEDLHASALLEERADEPARLAHDRGVEAAAKPAVRGHDDDEMDVVLLRADEHGGGRRPAAHALRER